MKSNYKFLSLLPLLWACGSEPTDKTTSNPPEKDTVVVVEEAPKDSFMVYAHIEFPAADGLTITANSYEVIPSKQYILLCHQAGYSRGEYAEIAKTLNEMGYNCLAIDQRSGESCNDVMNETAKRAKKEKKGQTYKDAEQDILASIDYIYNKTGEKVLLVGSSYSASLALKIASENDKISAVAAFSPGEYLDGIKVADLTGKIKVPVFATSSKEESKDVETILQSLSASLKTHFIPAEAGVHGASALWSETTNNAEYWDAFKAFLKSLHTEA